MQSLLRWLVSRDMWLFGAGVHFANGSSALAEGKSGWLLFSAVLFVFNLVMGLRASR